MKTRFKASALSGLLLLASAAPAFALGGEPYIHDPSTIMKCDGKYYTYGTGGGGLISEDGWTWHSGAERPGGGLAPDAIKIGDRYYLAYAAGGGGMNGGHAGNINTMWSKSLDPQSPDFGFKDNSAVASSDGIEDCDAIDPGFFLDPTTGRLWLVYGTFFGYTRVVELDPENGKRVPGNKPVDIAIDCEANDIIYHDGYYYLMGTHGTCCSGANSSYNIRAGRSKSVLGPYVDENGVDMLRGGGKLLIASNDRGIGAGHFGLIDEGDDVQKFSFHWEADLDRQGRSVLAIRPLLWKDGWPEAGPNFMGGTFEIQSERTGNALEMGVDPVPVSQGGMRGGFGGFGGRGGRRGGPGAAGAPTPAPTPEPTPIPEQTAADVSKNWPDTKVEARLGAYMLQAQQKWTISPVLDAGGYLGSPYFKITVAGTDRALAATDNGEVTVLPKFTGDANQLWRIDELTDGTWRIMPKAENKELGQLALTAIGNTQPSLVKFDPKNDHARWNLLKP